MLSFNFTPFPVLTSQNLILRQLCMDDTAEVFVQRSDATIRKFIKRPPALDPEEAKNWITKILLQEEKNETINWAITLKGEEKLIGLICLWNIEKENHLAEVGYSIHPDYFGKGFMTEALQAVCSYGFNEMHLKRIDAYTNKNNLRSLKLLEKNNFKRNFDFEKNYEDKEELEYNVIYTRMRR